MRKNCSTDQENLLKFEADGSDFAKNFKSQSEQFLKQNVFLTCSWRVLRSNRLKKNTIQIGEKYWDLGTCRKS